MVICSITSGLGNQLFQYAAGLHWIECHGGSLVLDASWFSFQKFKPRRIYQLEAFQIPEQKLSKLNACILFAARILSKKSAGVTDCCLRTFLRLETISETNFHDPDPRFSSVRPRSRHVWLNGYWQTADHFLAVRSLLRKRVQPNFPLSGGCLGWLKQIRNCYSVSVHIRRGDYAVLGHGMLTEKYYHAATGLFPPGSVWFVFSEDKEWCRENLRLPGATRFVDYESNQKDLEDLFLMTECRGAIIANSSYSWWGAALGHEEERLVVAPRFRHGPGEGDFQKNRLLPDWKKIDDF